MGNWYSCGIMTLGINDTTTFYKNSSMCNNNDCLYFKWIINKNETFKYGWEKGCEDTKIGFGLKTIYKWTFDSKSDIFIFKRRNKSEQFKVVILNDIRLTVTKIK